MRLLILFPVLKIYLDGEEMKTIKFNIIVDDTVIRSVEQLKDNFNIDDVYELYSKGILQKWLILKNEQYLSEKLDAISTGNIKEVILEILSVFDYTNKDTEASAFAFVYRSEYKEKIEEFKNNNQKYDSLIEEYHTNYKYLKKKLSNPKIFIDYNPANATDEDYYNSEEYYIQKAKEFSLIKTTVNEISDRYIRLFELDVVKFFNEYMDHNPIVIMACMMNKNLVNILLGDQYIKEQLEMKFDNTHLLNALNPHLQVYQGSTEGMWKYLGDKDKSYLVINMTVGGCRVGEQNALDVDFDYSQINGKYKLLKGLLFKSSSSTQHVQYLEV